MSDTPHDSDKDKIATEIEAVDPNMTVAQLLAITPLCRIFYDKDGKPHMACGKVLPDLENEITKMRF